jgi:glycosyltransferase involved in cell wall biosynthesis
MITVIFTIKNREKQRAKNCIDSLIGQDCRIIVVDYGSDDLSWYGDVFKTGFIAVKRDTKQFNKSRAYNIGFKQVTTPYTLFSDIDNIFAPNFIERVKQEIKEKTVILCQNIDLNEKGEAVNIHPKTGYGSCFCIDSDWIRKVRGHDEAYTYWGKEDDDMFMRAKQDGYDHVWLEPLIQHQYHENAPRPTLSDNRRYFEKKKPLIRNQSWGEL